MSCGRCLLGVDPTDRVSYDPGEIAQCDLWFPPVADLRRWRAAAGPAGAGDDGRLLPLTGAVMIPSRKAGDILAGHVGADQRLGPLPADAGVGSGVRDRRQRQADR